MPNGCVHEENVQDTFIDICEGYEFVSDVIQEGLIELSVANHFDPVEASVSIAECIKTKVNSFSLKMECAVEGLEHMDNDMMNKHWDDMVASYMNDTTKTNVKAHKETWTITFDEVEVNEREVV